MNPQGFQNAVTVCPSVFLSVCLSVCLHMQIRTLPIDHSAAADESGTRYFEGAYM